jgi:hypothetical protein
MTARTRIRLYRGATEAAAHERFRGDAVWALADGWHPAQWRWDGQVLRVVYTFAERPPAAPTPRRRIARRGMRWLPQLTGARRRA